MNIFNLLFGGNKTSRRTVTQLTEKNIVSDWRSISILISQKGPSSLKNALITADKTLDNALRDMVDGETMGDRLKNAENMFDRNLYNKIWEAHKIRNNLVHESGYEPPHFVITESIQVLKTALQSLGLRI
ncbi:MAG: hypothetical protein ABIJ82_02230 [Patescibacteria group bacterium]|nr:hypothetical protein [Patescibacteria group bacterium]MBU1952939.1 hypothetical protein [Patescibacteria group bacterium]